MGELLEPGGKFHDDIRLVGRAVKQRWPIPDDKKTEILKRLFDIVEDNPDDEVAIKAIGQLKSMEAQNQKDEQTAILHSDRNRFLEIANRLGIGKSIGGASGVGANNADTVVDGRVARK